MSLIAGGLAFLIIVVGSILVTASFRRLSRSEQGLRESEERFRLMVSGIKDYAIFMLDPEGYVASWNQGAERLKGYRAEEIIGRHFSCFFRAEDARSGIPDSELEAALAEGSLSAAPGQPNPKRYWWSKTTSSCCRQSRRCCETRVIVC